MSSKRLKPAELRTAYNKQAENLKKSLEIMKMQDELIKDGEIWVNNTKVNQQAFFSYVNFNLASTAALFLGYIIVAMLLGFDLMSPDYTMIIVVGLLFTKLVADHLQFENQISKMRRALDKFPKDEEGGKW